MKIKNPSGNWKQIQDSIISLSNLKVGGFFGQSSSVIAERITHKLLCYAWMDRKRNKEFISTEPIDAIDLSAIILDFKDKAVILKRKFQVRLMASFIKSFANLLFNFSSYKFENFNRVSIFHGVGWSFLFRNNSHNDFLQYLRDYYPQFLVEKKLILIETDTTVLNNPPAMPFGKSKIIFTQNPMKDLVRTLGVIDRLVVTAQTIKIFPTLLLNCITHRPFLLICSEFQNLILVNRLNQKSIIDSVHISNSSIMEYQIWHFYSKDRKFKTFFHWYSANSKNIRFSSNVEDCPAISFWGMRADHHYVCHKSEISYISSLTVLPPHNVTVDFRCLFSPKIVDPFLSSQQGCFIVSLFDANPQFEAGYDPNSNYYSVETIRNFVSTILSFFSTQRFQSKIYVKRKKNFNSLLEIPDHFLRIPHMEVVEVDYQYGFLDLIANSDLTLALPFSTPVYIANTINKASAFFDHTGLVKKPLHHPQIPIISTHHELYELIKITQKYCTNQPFLTEMNPSS